MSVLYTRWRPPLTIAHSSIGGGHRLCCGLNFKLANLPKAQGQYP